MADREYPLQIMLAGGWAQPAQALFPLQEQLAELGSVQTLTLDLPETELLSRTAGFINDYQGKTLAVGWSLGGHLLLRALTQETVLPDQEKLAGIALIACNPCFVGNEEWPGTGETLFSEFEQQLHQNPSVLLFKFMKLQLLGDPQFRTLFGALRPSLKITEHWPSEQLSISLGWLKSWDCRTQLNCFETVLHFFGQLDHINPAQLADVVADAFPQHKVFNLNGMAHYPNTKASAEIVRRIKEYLQA